MTVVYPYNSYLGLLASICQPNILYFSYYLGWWVLLGKLYLLHSFGRKNLEMSNPRILVGVKIILIPLKWCNALSADMLHVCKNTDRSHHLCESVSRVCL